MATRKAIRVLLAIALAVWSGCQTQHSEPAGATSASSPTPQMHVVVYYFHRTERCETCNTLEAYSHEAVTDGFADALAAGRLAWQTVNYEEPRNEHFRSEFDLIAPTLVLVAVDGDQAVQHRELSEIWTLFGDKAAFIDYVQRETAEFLDTATKK